MTVLSYLAVARLMDAPDGTELVSASCLAVSFTDC